MTELHKQHLDEDQIRRLREELLDTLDEEFEMEIDDRLTDGGGEFKGSSAAARRAGYRPARIEIVIARTIPAGANHEAITKTHPAIDAPMNIANIPRSTPSIPPITPTTIASKRN